MPPRVRSGPIPRRAESLRTEGGRSPQAAPDVRPALLRLRLQSPEGIFTMSREIEETSQCLAKSSQNVGPSAGTEVARFYGSGAARLAPSSPRHGLRTRSWEISPKPRHPATTRKMLRMFNSTLTYKSSIRSSSLVDSTLKSKSTTVCKLSLLFNLELKTNPQYFGVTGSFLPAPARGAPSGGPSPRSAPGPGPAEPRRRAAFASPSSPDANTHTNTANISTNTNTNNNNDSDTHATNANADTGPGRARARARKLSPWQTGSPSWITNVVKGQAEAILNLVSTFASYKFNTSHRTINQ